MNKSIAVIGQGFVGGSLTTVFSERGFTVFTYDKAGKHKTAPGGIPLATVYNNSLTRNFGDAERLQPKESISLLVDLLEKDEDLNFSKIYFVCVPTPMFEDGSADLSIVEGVLQELAEVPGERIAVVKSTVPPGSVERWNRIFGDRGLHVIFNPEFLTERAALQDMRSQNRIILGGPRPWINSVKEVFRNAFHDVPIIKTSSTIAEMVKYFTNNFLTVKVAFANEMSQICEALNRQGLDVDYDKVVEYAWYDERLGKSHWNVPGPDGKRGFGGHCFPKDINAMICVAKNAGVDPKLLNAAWEKNLEIRPEKDWEHLLGRAVSKKPV